MLTSIAMHWDYAVILIFFGFAVPWLGRRRIRHLMQVPQTTKRDRLGLYASTIAFQWFAAAVIFWRTRAHHIGAPQLGLAIPRVSLTVTAAVLMAGLIFGNQLFSLRRLGARPADTHGVVAQLALKIFPQDNMERAAFFVLVATVAACEEFIYRGFAQHIFEDWPARTVLAGIVGSAALFALAHLYQGRRGLVSTFVAGLLFAGVRAWTGSLLPSVGAHFVADLAAGYLAPGRIRGALASAVDEASREHEEHTTVN